MDDRDRNDSSEVKRIAVLLSTYNGEKYIRGLMIAFYLKN